MSLLDIFKKAPKSDNFRPSDNPTKYADTVFNDKAKESSAASSTAIKTAKSVAQTSTSKASVGVNSNIPGK